MPTKYLFMKWHAITTFICLAMIGFALFVSPSTAALPVHDVKTSIIEKISGTDIIWYDHTAAVAAIRVTSEYSSTEKLSAMSTLFGADEKLILFVNKPREEKTIESGGIIGDFIKGIGDLLGKEPAPEPTADEYSDEEGNAAWSQYLANYILNYEPTGDFGGPIK